MRITGTRNSNGTRQRLYDLMLDGRLRTTQQMADELRITRTSAQHAKNALFDLGLMTQMNEGDRNKLYKLTGRDPGFERQDITKPPPITHRLPEKPRTWFQL